MCVRVATCMFTPWKSIADEVLRNRQWNECNHCVCVTLRAYFFGGMSSTIALTVTHGCLLFKRAALMNSRTMRKRTPVIRRRRSVVLMALKAIHDYSAGDYTSDEVPGPCVCVTYTVRVRPWISRRFQEWVRKGSTHAGVYSGVKVSVYV